MTRLGHWGAELGHEHAEGLTVVTLAPTYDTGTVRSGTRSFKFDSGAGNSVTALTASFTGATGRSYYGLAHFRVPAASGLPASNGRLSAFLTAGAAALGTAVLLPTGKIRLLNSAGAQVGSDSAATVVADTWYRLELVVNINAAAGADDTLELYLDGVQAAASTAQTLGTTAPGLFRFGWTGTSPGASEVVFMDDLGLNDDQGSVNNGLVGDQKIYASLWTADSARLNWTDGAGGTANIGGSVDNIPPTGVSTATSGATNQIENPTSGAGAAFDATLQSYTAIGVAATDLITAIIPVVEIGSSSTTGSDTLTHSVVSNPAIAGTSSSCDIVAGTYPSSWNRFAGVITENPSVTKGTAPVMRLAKDVATTRINACCLMALSVAVLPNGSPLGTRYRSLMMVGD